jgi:hypothetical protein
VPAFRWSSRLVRAARAASLVLVPGASEAAGPSLVERVLPASLTGARATTALIGTPGGTCSIVVRLDEEGGRPVAMCKVAFGDHSDMSVQREASALRELGPLGLSPKLFALTEIEGRSAIIMSFVDGAPGSIGRHGVVEAVSALPPVGAGAPRWAAADHPWVQRIVAVHAQRDEVAAALEAVIARLPEEGWPEVRMHGDLAPWNILRTHGSGVMAIDWEETEAVGFWGADLAHYVMVTERLMHKATASRAVAAARTALVERLALSASAALTITLLTAASTAERERATGAAAAATTFWLDAVRECAKEEFRHARSS